MQSKPSSFSRSALFTMGIFGLLVVSFAVYAWAEHKVVDAIEQRHQSFLLADELRQTSDDLTKMVRIYVETGDVRYKNYYQLILDIRDGKRPRPLGYQKIYWDFVLAHEHVPEPGTGQSIALLDLMRQSDFTEEEFRKLEVAKTSSDALSKLERQAMQLLDDPGAELAVRQARASLLVTGPQYHAAKAGIMRPIGEFYALMEKRTTDSIRSAERDALVLRVVFILFGLSLMFMLYRTNNFLRATLGGSITQVFALITRIGRGNFTPAAALPQADENSVMGWLVNTQVRLNKVEHARQAAEEALRENEARYRALVEGSTDPILAHRDGVLVYLNPASVKALGASNASELLGLPWKKIVHSDFHQMSQERIGHTLQTGVPTAVVELKFVKLDGEVIDVESQSAAVMLDGLMSVQVSWRDITERKRLEDRVRQLAFYDALTNLPNRRLLDDRLHQSIVSSRRSGCFGALMFLDLDNFKPLNDTHGHVVGDLLLIDAAHRLKTCVREIDTVARFGGDEFVVMLNELSADQGQATAQAAAVAEKIRGVLSETYRLNVAQDEGEPTVVEHHCTVSVGVTVFTHDAASADEVLTQADTAMYQAKEEGRNTVRFFNSRPLAA